MGKWEYILFKKKETQMLITVFKNTQYPWPLGKCKLNYFEIPP